MHFRDVTFLLVLEDDSIPFNRYNLLKLWGVTASIGSKGSQGSDLSKMCHGSTAHKE